MDMKLGKQITALRKAKGMTQEQLAAAVGVSAPAVSKWETDSSCPDIAILCPLARALDTNVDMLLQFEDALSEEELKQKINEIVETVRTGNTSGAEAALKRLLCTYPSSGALKYNASAVMDMFLMLSPMETDAKKEEWKAWKKQLLEEILKGGPSVYRQNTVLRLASIAVQDGELEEAEKLLKECPEQAVDATMIWTQLYLKREERQKALETVQKRLYTLVGQAQTCLTIMMNEKLEPDVKRQLEICEIYRLTEEVFGVGGGFSAGLFAEIYQRMGQQDKAMEKLIQVVEVLTSSARIPNPLVFSEVVKIDENRPAASREMKEMVLQGLLTDESCAPFRENEKFQSVVEKLRNSI